MKDKYQYERGDLGQVRASLRHLFVIMGLFSFLVNLLLLTGPLYMLHVYDRVLPSGAVQTLVALSLMALLAYSVMGALDHTRSRITARIAARFLTQLDQQVFSSAMQSAQSGQRKEPQAALKDLASIEKFIASSALLALFDLPWIPVFFAGIYLFHPLLGAMTLVSGMALIGLSLANQWASRSAFAAAMHCTEELEAQTQQYLNRARLIRALGMQSTTRNRQHHLQLSAQIAQLRASDISGLFTALTKTLRMAVQSAMLGLGAWLVLQEQLSAGGMIATSILFGRLLSPIEVLIGSWAVPQRALLGWARLRGQLYQEPARNSGLALPRPAAQLSMHKATIVPPGGQIATLKLASFSLQAGSACGIIGAAGSGKSTLALAAMGVLPLANGTVQLGGTALTAYDTDKLGQYIGYLPQKMQLLPGTVAENITRYQTDSPQDLLFTAARNAGAFEMITQMPQGFDTDVRQLSGGQAQRVGLARALFGDPVLLVLDEPNSNLDNEGVAALNAAVRRFKRKGNTVLIIAHRPAAIQECDTLMVIESGQITAFGPKEDILRKMVKNHADISALSSRSQAPHAI
ncbi:type I secretion system permease/ATPase [Planktomarina sp.]|uniref:type I secretion system permease/ATPase n=1 Tax=Planktomarina sp. TaxID=2024851 RepID=UPI003C38CEFA